MREAGAYLQGLVWDMVEAVCQHSQVSSAATHPSCHSLPSTQPEEELNESTWTLKEALQAALPELAIGGVIGSGGISTCFAASVRGSSELRAVKVTHRGASQHDSHSFVAKLAEVLHVSPSWCCMHVKHHVSPRCFACVHPQSWRPEAGQLLP